MEIFKKSAFVSVFGSPMELLLLLSIAVALGLIVAWIYRKTHKGFSYSQSFSVAVVLMTVITTLIIFLIKNNIAAGVGVFGAFSIIRFRTAIKDVRDISFIFFALALGVAIGLNLVSLAIVGALVIGVLIYVLHKTNFGGLRKFEYVLNFKLEARHHSNDVFKSVMDGFLKKQALLNVDAKEKGQILIFTFNISLKDDERLHEFIADMNKIEGVSDVNVISSKNDVEF